ncbi:MCE family protein [Kibdelosporangium phytohabitans]|uniref:ABC transporter substrate-binding protein n=1 Tax=Kibdelosporangium phytohabitans TaxID=860235 RepID=A0A0N9I8G9_9PSEU|nr:MCE family protein [Kibdelosporangium phytohabitans]ALG11083.1 ABC transporter substrate-binding protein [Kibdelosporangium phytohabitans]MBE1462325.1 phospholipid/cholesterol/gamma-HCH transport system substrate-binding protein [Kibdelosporangium phytohabitans]
MRGLVAPLLKVIVFAIVTVASTGLLGLTIANVDLRPSYDYSARFADVTSLSVGDDVRIAGVRVGQVETIDLVDKRVAKVAFTVDARRELPASVTATIKYRNMIGQRYISLERGVGPVGGIQEPGTEIPLQRTKPALDLTVLFNGFKPLFQALSPDDVNKLSHEIIQVLQGEGGTVESLLRHTASLTSTLAEKDQVIGEVIGNLNQVLDTVNEHSGELGGLLTTLQQFVTGFAKDRQPIGEAISSLDELAGATAGLLEDGRAPLKDSMTALGQVAKNLADNEKTVDQALKNLPVKMESIGRTVSYGSWLNTFLCSAQTGTPLPMPMAAGIPVTQPRCK